MHVTIVDNYTLKKINKSNTLRQLHGYVKNM